MNSVTQYGIPESDLDALLSELKKKSVKLMRLFCLDHGQKVHTGMSLILI